MNRTKLTRKAKRTLWLQRQRNTVVFKRFTPDFYETHLWMRRNLIVSIFMTPVIDVPRFTDSMLDMLLYLTTQIERKNCFSKHARYVFNRFDTLVIGAITDTWRYHIALDIYKDIVH